MKLRHQLLWLLCAGTVWTGVWYFNRPTAAQARPGPSPAEATHNLALIEESQAQENRGRYQLLLHADGIMIFDTATAEAWTRIPPATNWTHVPAPAAIQRRSFRHLIDPNDPLGIRDPK